jgi:signal transduction histidine kinase/CheY-like chemotaxis protein
VGDRLVRVARDVGEQRRLYARLVQADKLAAVGVLASGAAHEINNPTAFVTSNLTELRRYVAAYEAALGELSDAAVKAGQAARAQEITGRADVTFARREAGSAIAESLQGMERVRQIVNNLRSLARRDQAGEPAAPVELGEIIQAVVRTAASDLRHASARVDLQGPVWVTGHRGELVDVILNVVVNAVQAREEGRANRIAIELTRDGPHAVVTVSDTGKGITASHMKRIFEPFFTTKAPGVGTGLGLATVYGIVKQSGGFMGVSSTPGKGTTFEIFFPRHDLAEDGFPRSAGSDAQPGSETVLVVEDDPGVRALVVRALREAGYRVLPASGGDEAEFIARELDGPLDLLLTDVVMPGRTGPEVARAITAIRPGVPVLFVSGYTHDAIGRKGELPEGTDLLQKPFTPEALLARVRSVLDRRGIPAA